MTDSKKRSYSDIINLSHHRSPKRQPMSQEMRAAQFAPFAALTGYDESISETARLTSKKIEPDDETAERLNETLVLLSEKIKSRPTVKVCYFVPDGLKQGGKYVCETGNLRVIDTFNRLLVFTNGMKINIDDILNIEVQ